MKVAYPQELPERDVRSLNLQQLSQMKDKDIATSASSIISNTERDQILGRPVRRRKIKSKSILTKPPTSTTGNSPNIARSLEEPQKENTSFEIISYPSKDRFQNPSKEKDATSFEIISYPSKDQQQNPSRISKKTESFEILSHTKSAENPKTRSRDSLFYYMPLKGSKDSLSKHPKAVVCLCEGCTESKGDNNSMKKIDNTQFTRVQTQTIGIQTSSELDCRCQWRTNTLCDCKPQCDCPGCRCGFSDKEVNVPEKASKSALEDQTESSSQTTDTVDPCSFCCTCDSYWRDRYDGPSTTDPFSDNSDDSYTTDFFDLPYQNNEEYLKLLRELEKKLVARNRERVKKTMLEFEKRSRQNQNLDKPIVDYDYSDDNACLLRKLSSQPPRGRHVCCKFGKAKKVKKVNSDIMQNEKRWDQMNFVQSVIQTSDPNMGQNQNASRLERSVHKSHWQLDPRSGEWIKMSCFQQTDYARHPPPPQGDYLKDDHKPFIPQLNMRKKECQCRQKKRR